MKPSNPSKKEAAPKKKEAGKKPGQVASPAPGAPRTQPKSSGGVPRR